MLDANILPNYYSCFRISYFPGGEVSGSIQVNSDSRINYYSEFLPESVIIETIPFMEKLFSGLDGWIHPVYVCHNIYNTYLPSKNFIEFLTRASNDSHFMSHVYFSPSDFGQIKEKLELKEVPFVQIGFTENEYNFNLEKNGTPDELKDRILKYVNDLIYPDSMPDKIFYLLKAYIEKSSLIDDNFILLVLKNLTDFNSEIISFNLLNHKCIADVLKSSPYIKKITVSECGWLKNQPSIWTELMGLISNLPNLEEIYFSSTTTNFPVDSLPSLSIAVRSRTNSSLSKVNLSNSKEFKQGHNILSVLQTMKDLP